jgi:hypothetical protein
MPGLADHLREQFGGLRREQLRLAGDPQKVKSSGYGTACWVVILRFWHSSVAERFPDDELPGWPSLCSGGACRAEGQEDEGSSAERGAISGLCNTTTAERIRFYTVLFGGGAGVTASLYGRGRRSSGQSR